MIGIRLEMTFSRGLYSGWMHGVNHQELVGARYGKKRGPFAGRITAVERDHLEVDAALVLKPGDGLAFDTGGDTNAEQGGRIYEIRGPKLYFEPGASIFAASRSVTGSGKPTIPRSHANCAPASPATSPRGIATSSRFASECAARPAARCASRRGREIAPSRWNPRSRFPPPSSSR